MQQTRLEDGTTKVCFLKKTLYGFKQAPRARYQTFLDFYKTNAVLGLFVSADKTICITVYIVTWSYLA